MTEIEGSRGRWKRECTRWNNQGIPTFGFITKLDYLMDISKLSSSPLSCRAELVMNAIMLRVCSQGAGVCITHESCIALPSPILLPNQVFSRTLIYAHLRVLKKGVRPNRGWGFSLTAVKRRKRRLAPTHRLRFSSHQNRLTSDAYINSIDGT